MLKRASAEIIAEVGTRIMPRAIFKGYVYAVLLSNGTIKKGIWIWPWLTSWNQGSGEIHSVRWKSIVSGLDVLTRKIVKKWLVGHQLLMAWKYLYCWGVFFLELLPRDIFRQSFSTACCVNQQLYAKIMCGCFRKMFRRSKRRHFKSYYDLACHKTRNYSLVALM